METDLGTFLTNYSGQFKAFLSGLYPTAGTKTLQAPTTTLGDRQNLAALASAQALRSQMTAYDPRTLAPQRRPSTCR
ncbi:MAG: hypothetical protein M5R40_06610 [Anaerolineae bacterium]|nr:hypothetical protein [Anaerolineae bacterium]